MTTLRFLEFDTALFGYRVAMVADIEQLDDEQAAVIASIARADGVRLVYVNAKKMPSLRKDGLRLTGVTVGLTSERVEFTKPIIRGVDAQQDGRVSKLDRDTLSQHDYAMLLELGLVSGQWSRFRLDAMFTAGEFEKLYRIWVEKAVTRLDGSFAGAIKLDGVFRAIGTVSACQDGVSTVGLLAVDPNCQGQGIGTVMLDWIEMQAMQCGAGELRIPTQRENKGACHFYEVKGYIANGGVFQTHLWIDDEEMRKR